MEHAKNVTGKEAAVTFPVSEGGIAVLCTMFLFLEVTQL